MGWASKLNKMILHKINFTSEKANYFALFNNLFGTRGTGHPYDMNNIGDYRITREDFKTEAGIRRKLKKIGNPIGNPPKDLRKEIDSRDLELKDEGGVLELTVDEFKLIEKYIGTMQWPPNVTDVVEDFNEWILATKGEELK